MKKAALLTTTLLLNLMSNAQKIELIENIIDKGKLIQSSIKKPLQNNITNEQKTVNAYLGNNNQLSYSLQKSIKKDRTVNRSNSSILPIIITPKKYINLYRKSIYCKNIIGR